MNADLIALVSLCGIACFCIAVSWLAERLLARAERALGDEIEEDTVDAAWGLGQENE